MARKKDEKVETLSNGPIEEVDLGAPPVVTGTTKGLKDPSIQDVVDRSTVDVVAVAPVIADATAKNPVRELGEGKPIRKFMVVNSGGKHVNDPGGGGRVFLHEGKIISNQHYPIRKLQEQGVRVKEVTGTEDDEPIDMYKD